MSVYVLNSFLILSLASLFQGEVNSCEKKYFEVSINEDADLLGEVIYGLLTNERCGVAKVQICPPSLSYTSPDSNYYDSAYKQWLVPGEKNSSLISSLDFKFQRSEPAMKERKRNATSISLPSDILALFEFFHAVSSYYNI